MSKKTQEPDAEREAAMARVIVREPHPRDAYDFLLEALNSAIESAGKGRKDVSAVSLLRHFAVHAQTCFGFAARAVLREWLVDGAATIGRMVWALVEEDLLMRQAEDSPADFVQGTDEYLRTLEVAEQNHLAAICL